MKNQTYLFLFIVILTMGVFVICYNIFELLAANYPMIYFYLITLGIIANVIGWSIVLVDYCRYLDKLRKTYPKEYKKLIMPIDFTQLLFIVILTMGIFVICYNIFELLAANYSMIYFYLITLGIIANVIGWSIVLVDYRRYLDKLRKTYPKEYKKLIMPIDFTQQNIY